jgi:hypothetical protein
MNRSLRGTHLSRYGSRESGGLGWRRCLPPMLEGGRWWGSLVFLRPEQGVKWHRGSSVKILERAGKLREPPIGGVAASG